MDTTPAPGRPTLMRLTGATDHAIKKALTIVATEQHQTTRAFATHPAGGGGNEGGVLGDFTLVSPPDHQPPAALATTAASTSPPPNPPTELRSPTAFPDPPAGGPLAVTGDNPGGVPSPDQRPGATLAPGLIRLLPAAPGAAATTPVGHRPADPLAPASTSPPPANASPSPGHQPHHQTPPADSSPGGKLVAWTGFVFGSLVSIAGNVVASRIPPSSAPPDWRPSLVAQAGAAVWPLMLLLAVESLARVRWPSGALWKLARYGGVVGVATGSAAISYGHIHAVLQSWGYSHLAAAVGPLVIDGLMVVAGFALLATAKHQAGAKPSPAGEPPTNPSPKQNL